MITMEMKYSRNRLDNVLSGIKSLIFPSLNLEPIRLNEVYNDRNKNKDFKKIREDYRKSVRGIRKEVVEFDRRATK